MLEAEKVLLVVLTVRGRAGTMEPCVQGVRDPGWLATKGMSLRFFAIARGMPTVSSRMVGERGVRSRVLGDRVDRTEFWNRESDVGTLIGAGLWL